MSRAALALLCEAEAATVVNNCAAALLLIVQHFTRKAGRARPPGAPEVVISRGELVQIGGGFRISEIVAAASGAKLREVGATNKTTLEDYAHAIGPETAMILKVHRSNFFMSGFVESPSSNEISALAKKNRIPFVEDLGSGAMIATESLGIAEHEPTPGDVLKAGADLVCFSGDKLFGGPQAGIIAGKKRFDHRAETRTAISGFALRQALSCRLANDCGSSPGSKNRRNPGARAVTNFRGRIARPCRSDCFEFGGFANEDRNRSRQSENRRWYVAKIECAIRDDRFHSRRFVTGRVRSESSCVESACNRLHRR